MAGPRRRNLLSQILQNDRLGTPMLIGWMVLALIAVVWDQLLLMPTPPPNAAQLQAARPRALADWRRLQAEAAEAQRRDGVEPEFGAVWTIRTGAICGIMNTKKGGIDAMSRFHTVDGRLVTPEEDRRAYLKWWLDCLDTPWVWLHQGTEKTGFCASKRGRESALGHDLCRNGEGWPTQPPAPMPRLF